MEVAHGSSGGHGVHIGAEEIQRGIGRNPGGHNHRVGEQERASCQRRVQEVAADATEQLLDHHNGEEVADDDRPIGNGHRAYHSQQQAGDNGGTVADGGVLF